MNLAIIIGVSKYKYDTYGNLPACTNDAELFKDVLTDVKQFDDVLYLNTNQEAYEINRSISNFVQSHQDDEVDEVVFYFSGHGERIDGEFYYLCTDFIKSKKGTTGISNGFLDGLIRNLSPKLYVKFVDACFSGTPYIKSETNYEREFKLSAESNKLNNIYFFFSSRADTESEAGPELSSFSESIFSCVLDRLQDLKYHDLMAYVADDLERRGAPTPIFISQATLLESFGEVKLTTHALINSKMGLVEDTEELVSEVPVDEPITLLKLIESKSSSLCCTKDEAISNLDLFNKLLMPKEWPSDITSIFNIELEYISNQYIPNIKKVGEWLLENEKLKLFALPSYKDVEHKTQEYKALPKKPTSNLEASGVYGNKLSSIWATKFGANTEYKLETVFTTKKELDGISYPYNNEYARNVVNIQLKPKFEAVDYYNLTIVLMYSKSKLSIHFSYELLSSTHWDTVSNPRCSKWKNLIVSLKPEDKMRHSASLIINEASSWISDKVTSNVNDL